MVDFTHDTRGTDDETFRALFSGNEKESPVDDLADTVRALHEKLNGRDHSPDMLRAVLSTLQELTDGVTHLLKRDEQITKAVRRVQRDTRRVSAAQELLARATQQGLTGVQKALGTTGTPLQKVRGGTTAPRVPAGDPRLSPTLVKAMGQRLVQWFGPSGGYTVAYNRERAAALLMKGIITAQEQRNWWKFYGNDSRDKHGDIENRGHLGKLREAIMLERGMLRVRTCNERRMFYPELVIVGQGFQGRTE